ncbi:MAG: T9SS type A sorting domain-containing protein [Flavobacteriales bacterium]|nr:T9SS type A sorting domain-containing protein [Flavobacteriales bacterium]
MKKLFQQSFALLPFLLLMNYCSTQAQSLKSVMINACGSSEGDNEYLILQNGGSSLTVSPSTIDIRYGTTSPASTTYTDAIAASGNSGFVSGLNTKLSGSCDFAFVNASNGSSIPANSYFIVMNDAPLDTPNFSAWCGNSVGNVYVVFSTDASFTSSGNFANAGATARYFRTIINGVDKNYNYIPNNLSNTDGSFAAWSDTGVASTSGNYSSCQPTNLASLPVELIYFNLAEGINELKLMWATAMENQNLGFEIQRKTEANDWERLDFVVGNGSSNRTISYEYKTLVPTETTYFRLKQMDFNGQYVYSAILKFEPKMKKPFFDISPNPTSESVQINFAISDEESTIILYNSVGQQIKNERITAGQSTLGISNLPGDIYTVVWQNGKECHTKRLIVL